MAPSGTLAYLEAGTGQIYDVNLKLQRSLTLQAPDNHASLGQLANGHDTWNGTVYDDGNDDAKSNVGNLVTWDLTDGTGGAIIGPKTGFPYPPDGHVSAMAYRQPGWIFVSTYGNTSGAGLLDLENLIADTNTGKVCRVGRHRSFGKANNVIGYWAESHTVPSPSGTRAVFASDWGGGNSVDATCSSFPAISPDCPAIAARGDGLPGRIRIARHRFVETLAVEPRDDAVSGEQGHEARRELLELVGATELVQLGAFAKEQENPFVLPQWGVSAIRSIRSKNPCLPNFCRRSLTIRFLRACAYASQWRNPIR